MRIPSLLLLAAILIPTNAWAEDRDYCPDRPGIGTPACTMAPGRFSLEVGMGDWTLDRNQDQRQDVILVGDALLRYGIADHAEVQLGWSTLGFSRTRDRMTGQVEHRNGTGDVTLAVKRNLIHPDGSDFSVALLPSVTLPIGREPIGMGDWSAGLAVPVTYELSDRVNLQATSHFDAAVDEDGHGRHFAFDQVVGANLKLSGKLTATAEYQITADRDPEGHHIEHLSGLSLAWQPGKDLQLDLGVNAGLDHDAPDAELYFGVSRRF